MPIDIPHKIANESGTWALEYVVLPLHGSVELTLNVETEERLKKNENGILSRLSHGVKASDKQPVFTSGAFGITNTPGQ